MVKFSWPGAASALEKMWGEKERVSIGENLDIFIGTWIFLTTQDKQFGMLVG